MGRERRGRYHNMPYSCVAGDISLEYIISCRAIHSRRVWALIHLDGGCLVRVVQMHGDTRNGGGRGGAVCLFV